MAALNSSLLSAAFDVVFHHGALEGKDALHAIEIAAPRFKPEQYAEAFAAAECLEEEGYKLAQAWFANGGKSSCTAADLSKLCPGFTPREYSEAINLCTEWARK
jgi:hypothetical protein